MPLSPGNSRAVISGNIREMIHSGYPQRQAIAASLSNAHRHPSSRGGLPAPRLSGNIIPHTSHNVPGFSASLHMTQPHISSSTASPWTERSEAAQMVHRAFGGADGGMSMSMNAPWTERSEARQMVSDTPFTSGLIGGNSGGGRTDRLPLKVPAESHVVTADVVSGLGQGDTHSGASLFQQALRSGPYGVPLPHEHRGHGPPHAPAVSQHMMDLAKGGRPNASILAATGEFVVPPEDWLARDPHDGQLYWHAGVRSLGKGDLKRGHQALDRMMANVRSHSKNFLKNAPAPAR